MSEELKKRKPKTIEEKKAWLSLFNKNLRYDEKIKRCKEMKEVVVPCKFDNRMPLPKIKRIYKKRNPIPKYFTKDNITFVKLPAYKNCLEGNKKRCWNNIKNMLKAAAKSNTGLKDKLLEYSRKAVNVINNKIGTMEITNKFDKFKRKLFKNKLIFKTEKAIAM